MITKRYLYETTVIINASLEDPQIETVVSRIQEVITKNEGEIKAVDKWGRKRLTYPIKKKNNGFYLNIEFEAPPAIVKQLDHLYTLDEQILRSLTIRVDKKALKARALAPPVKPADETVVVETPVTGKEAIFDEEEPAA